MYKSGFLFLIIAVVCSAAFDDRLVGGITELQGKDFEEAQKSLETSLSKLAAGDGPNFTLVKVHSVSSQVVSGMRYRYETELKTVEGDIKKCHISIWSQPWLKNGIEVTFKCEGEDEFVKRHSA